MVKVHVVFKGETMAEVRERMQAWATEYMGSAVPATEAPAPPRKRSFKGKSLEAPIPPEAPPAPAVDPVQIDLTDLVAEETAPPEPSGMGSEAVMAAATRFAEAHGKPALKKLLKTFKVAKVRDLPAGQQVAFLTACAAGPA